MNGGGTTAGFSARVYLSVCVCVCVCDVYACIGVHVCIGVIVFCDNESTIVTGFRTTIAAQDICKTHNYSVEVKKWCAVVGAYINLSEAQLFCELLRERDSREQNIREALADLHEFCQGPLTRPLRHARHCLIAERKAVRSTNSSTLRHPVHKTTPLRDASSSPK